jgi:hypothetical protein
MYGVLYGISLIFIFFQIKLCECRISKFTEFFVVKYTLQYEISRYGLSPIRLLPYRAHSPLRSQNPFLLLHHIYIPALILLIYTPPEYRADKARSAAGIAAFLSARFLPLHSLWTAFPPRPDRNLSLLGKPDWPYIYPNSRLPWSQQAILLCQASLTCHIPPL